MYELGVVHRNIERVDPALAAQAAGFGTATMHEAQGRTGLLQPYMRPVFAGARVAGPAVTVLMHPGDNWMLHVAAAEIAPGDVVVAAVTAQWFLERWFTPDFRKDHEDDYQALLKSAQTEVTPQGYAGFCMALREVDLRAALSAITAPTLFIAGRHDATPIAVVEGIASSVPDARVVVIEDAAHISNMEQPRAFTRAAVDFLKR